MEEVSMAESAAPEEDSSAKGDSDAERSGDATRSRGDHDADPAPLDDMLAKIAAYVRGEAEMSIEDYRLLQSMNLAAAERYSGMAEYSAGLVVFAERLQNKFDDMLPQLAQVGSNPHAVPLPREPIPVLTAPAVLTRLATVTDRQS